MKLKKTDIKRRNEISTQLDLNWTDLESAVTEFNEAAKELWDEKILPAMEAYNEALEMAREWRDNRVSEFNDFISDKSEKWQESDKGQAAQALTDEYESADLDDIEVELFEEVEFNIEAHHETVDQLPESDEQ